MEARLHPMGATAALVEVDDTDAALALRAALRSAIRAASESALEAVDELVVGARSVLVRVSDPARLAAVVEAALGIAGATSSTLPAAASVRQVEVPVVYDGPDLDEVARLTGLSREEVVQAHTGTEWKVGFGGFAPGFAYLVGGDTRLWVPRRDDPRERVPAGSVALAGEFSGIYPQDSPGGWQILGSTDLVLWDAARNPPALLEPGTTVRFRAISAMTVPSVDPTPWPSDEQRAPLVPGLALEVLATGPLVLVEDLGRRGLADAGVPRSGAADQAAYLLGLRLVGHLLGTTSRAAGPDAAAPAALEVVLGGLVARARGDLLLAITGAPCPASVDGRPVPLGAPFALRDGQVLRLDRATSGLRTYVAARGGLAVPPVLGSRSSDTLSGLGPPAVAVGDVLPIGEPPPRFPVTDLAPLARSDPGTAVVLGMTLGPRADWCDLTALTRTTWTVSPRSSRVGIRLQGMQVARRRGMEGQELPSEGLVPGAIQVPSGGEPVVFLADHPVTGGYPVVAVLTSKAIDRAAQLRPGDEVRLVWS
ncbi:5-oxoprolinase/urea amidolyase family protein [Intrasporangium mesophilum]